jgi:hypothetical protein
MVSGIDGFLLRRTADLPVQAPTNYELVINPQRPPGPSASPCRRPCSRAPTR